MSNRVSAAAALVFLVAVPALVISGSFSNSFGGGGGAVATSAADIVAAVSDAGTLAQADKDLHANTFVANALAPDGGPGTYAFMCSGSPCYWKMGPGSQNELRATSNQVDHEVALTRLQTVHMNQWGCKASQSCVMYTDPGTWISYSPSDTTTGCTSSTKGGIRATSTNSRLVYCDGTTVQQVGFALSNSASLNFPSMNNNEDATLTMTVTGAATTDAVHCSPTVAIETGLQVSYSYVSSANTVTVVLHDASGGTVDPAAANYKCVVMR